MVQPREKTFHELLRQTQKIPKPEVSPVFTENVRMQGPGVKEICCKCDSLISAPELWQCSACNCGFHTTCVGPPVNILDVGLAWCCGLCNDYTRPEVQTEATNSIIPNQTVVSQRKLNSVGLKGPRKVANISNSKEIVLQVEAGPVESRSIVGEGNGEKVGVEPHADTSHTPNVSKDTITDDYTRDVTPESSRRSKQGRLFKATGGTRPDRNRRADSKIARPLEIEPDCQYNDHESLSTELVGESNAYMGPQHIEAAESAAGLCMETEGVGIASTGLGPPGIAKHSALETSGLIRDDVSIKDAATNSILHNEMDTGGDLKFPVYSLQSRKASSKDLLVNSVSGLQAVNVKDNSQARSSIFMGKDDIQANALANPGGNHDLVGFVESPGGMNEIDKGQRFSDGLLVDTVGNHFARSADLVLRHQMRMASLEGPSGLPGLVATVAGIEPSSPSGGLEAGLKLPLRRDIIELSASEVRAPVSDLEAAKLLRDSTPSETYFQKTQDKWEEQEGLTQKEVPSASEDGVGDKMRDILGNLNVSSLVPSRNLPQQENAVAIDDSLLRKLPEDMKLSLPDAKSNEEPMLNNGLRSFEGFAGQNHSVSKRNLLLEQDAIDHNAQEFGDKLLEKKENYEQVTEISQSRVVIVSQSSQQPTDVEMEAKAIDATVSIHLAPRQESNPHSSTCLTSSVGSKPKQNTIDSNTSVGFASQSKSQDAATTPMTPHSPWHPLQEVDCDAVASLAARASKPLDNVPSSLGFSSLQIDLSSSTNLHSISAIPVCVPLSTGGVPKMKASSSEIDVDSSDLDSQLTKLVSGLPVPSLLSSQRRPMIPMKGVNATMAIPVPQPVCTLLEPISSPVVSLGQPNKELLKEVESRPTERGSSEVLLTEAHKPEAESGPSTQTKSSFSDEDETGSQSILLVEDVKVCDICGNSGYEKLLAVCSTCNEGAEHIYCMHTQMGEVPEDWSCEACMLRQKTEGLKQLERLPSFASSLSHSSSLKSRQRPPPIQGSSRSRLSSRLNHKRPGNPISRSPCKILPLLTPSKRPAGDSIPSPCKKLAVECSAGAADLLISPRPSLTRENSFKSGPDAGKVKYLSPAAVTNISPGVRQSPSKAPSLATLAIKVGVNQTGPVSNKSKSISLSNCSESTQGIGQNKGLGATAIRSSSPRALSTQSFPRGPGSVKFSSNLPSFLLNASSLAGNGVKGSVLSRPNKHSLSKGLDETFPQSQSIEPLRPSGQPSGSRVSGSTCVKLGKSPSSRSLPLDLKVWPDTPRPLAEYGRTGQRSRLGSESASLGVQLQSNTSFTGIPKGKQGVKEQSGFLSAIGKSEVQQDKGLQKQELKHADDMCSSLEVSPLKSSEQVMGSEKNAGISFEMEILHLSNKRTTQSVDIPAPTGVGLPSNVSWLSCLSKYGHMDAPNKVLITEASSPNCEQSFGGRFASENGVVELMHVAGQPLQSALGNTGKSALWSAATTSTRCYKCKELGHSASNCKNRNLPTDPLTELKATSTWSSFNVSKEMSPSNLNVSKEISPSNLMDAEVSDVITTPLVQEGRVEITQAHTVLKVNQIQGEAQKSGSMRSGLQQVVPSLNSAECDLPKTTSLPSRLVSSTSDSPASLNTFSTVSEKLTSRTSSPVRCLSGTQSSAAISSTFCGDLSRGVSWKAQTQSSKPVVSVSYTVEAEPAIPGLETHISNPAGSWSKDSKLISSSVISCTDSVYSPKVPPQGKGMQPVDGLVPPPHSAMLIPNRAVSWGPRPQWTTVDKLVASGSPLDFPPGPLGHPPGNLSHVPPPGDPLHLQCIPVPSDSAVPDDVVAWRGTFEVVEGQTTTVYDNIQAHPSTKAASKVHEVVRGMPQRLLLEQVQRAEHLDTWPRPFVKQPPTDGSIALYFFATNGDSFSRFRGNLVEQMVARDLVLRAQVDDAELLVFPSSQLPERFQLMGADEVRGESWQLATAIHGEGWHGNMFLWGVFRAKKHALVAAVAILPKALPVQPSLLARAASMSGHGPATQLGQSSASGGDNMGEVDMEVDMEGGKECGVADKAVKRSGSANPSSSALPTNVSIVEPPVHSGGQWSMPGVGTEHSQDKCEQVESRNIDLPPGFAPMLHEEDPGLSRPPGFESKVEALRQHVGPGNSADTEMPDSGSSHLHRDSSVLEHVKSLVPGKLLPPALNSTRSNLDDVGPHVVRSSTRQVSRSSSESPVRHKEKHRDEGRERGHERGKSRERRKDHNNCHRRDRERNRSGHLHRDRDRNGERDRDKVRLRDIYSPKDRGGKRVRDPEKGRGTAREGVKERSLNKGECEQKRVREQERESRGQYGPSCSHSPGKSKPLPRSPPRSKPCSPSPVRRYPSSHHRSGSFSESPNIHPQDPLQRGSSAGRWPQRAEVNHTGRSFSDRDGGHEEFGSGLHERAELVAHYSTEDNRSESGGASTSLILLNADQLQMAAASQSLSPGLDINEVISRRFSAEDTQASTSLPDLNKQDEAVPFQSSLAAEVAGPSTDAESSPHIAEQTFFPGAQSSNLPHTVSMENAARQEGPEISAAREDWRIGTGSFSRRPEFAGSSTAYPFIQAEIDLDVNRDVTANPDLELALGGGERSSGPVEPLPLFVQLLDRAEIHVQPSSPELAFVGLNGRERTNSPDQVLLSSSHVRPGKGASLLLSLAVPQYRKEGNSWVEVEEEAGALGLDDVEFALTL